MLDALILGEALVDMVAVQRGPLSEVRTFQMCRGGASANVAANLARLGGRAGFVGTVGDDDFGRFLQRSLTADGVDVADLRRVPGERTALCFVTVGTDGDRSFTYGGGSADLAVCADDVRAERAVGARTVLFTSGTLRTPHGIAAVDRLVEHGAVVCCDPGISPASADTTDALWARIPGCDLLKLSEDDLQALFGGDLHAAVALLREMVPLLVVTQGGAGARWYAGETEGHVEAPQVEVVDTNGAGDAFMAGLLLKLGRTATWSPELYDDAVRYACQQGAAAVGRRGA